MKIDTKQLRESVQALRGGDKKTELPPAPIEKPKVEKLKTGGKTPGHGPLSNNGGTRPGSGRKPLPFDEGRRSLKKLYEEFAMEEDEMMITDKRTNEVRIEKRKKARIVLESLYKKAKTGDVGAIKEFNDRMLGKPKQPITGGDEDDTPLRLDVDMGGVIDKIYGDSDS